MTKAALDYSKLARLYDDYCVYAGDIGFFRRCVRDWPGETLELMAGTGRVSLPLARDGASLTCVDSSPAMLGVLHRKLRGAGTGARIVCADARSLPFRCTFQLVLLPFQGLTELPSANDQARALRAAADLLSPSGRFVCTTHNPAVRLRSVDGSWQRVGTFPRRDGGSLTVHILGTYDDRRASFRGSNGFPRRTRQGPRPISSSTYASGSSPSTSCWRSPGGPAFAWRPAMATTTAPPTTPPRASLSPSSNRRG